MNLSEAIQHLISNPDDLSSLPAVLEQAREIEGEVEGYQSRIISLQEGNRSLLSQIPIHHGKIEEEVEEEQEPTLEDAQAYLIEVLGGNE